MKGKRKMEQESEHCYILVYEVSEGESEDIEDELEMAAQEKDNSGRNEKLTGNRAAKGDREEDE